MLPLNHVYPDLQSLSDGLTKLLQGERSTGNSVEVLGRRQLVPTMTFPVEIVTCRVNGSRKLSLFCKYAAGRSHNAHGHRGGVAYEGAVYRTLLQPMAVSTPRFFGVLQDRRGREAGLVLEFLECGTLLRDLELDLQARPKPTPMGLAARWIGRFHAASAVWVRVPSAVLLHHYDADYYLGWARRTAKLARPLRRRCSWLAVLCARAPELLAPLLNAPPVVIHGEYYQNNIMVCGRKIYPTDWESTAVAAGEIDLAALTEGPWRPEVVRQCEHEYQRARWPDGTPADFARTLDAARLYLHFRWLGERPDWTLRDSNRWRFGQLRSVATRLGLI